MLYATAADLVARYGDQVAQMVGGDPASAPVVLQALGDAAVEIDAFLAGRFDLPLPGVPNLLTNLAADIAVYRLQVLTPNDLIEDARRRYEDALKRLRDIREGRLDLGLPTATAAPGPSPVMVTHARRLFSRERMRGF